MFMTLPSARENMVIKYRQGGADMGKKGWIVTVAGIGLNLALGILYALSMFTSSLASHHTAIYLPPAKSRATSQ